MTAAWVAVSVRGRRVVRRTTNPGLARGLVEVASWDDAVALLGRSSYREQLGGRHDRDAVRRAVLEATVWRLRVLAGWLPAGQSSLARLFAAPIEIGNIEQRIAELGRAPGSPTVQLGALSVVSHRLPGITSLEALRQVLARSAWGDPGGDDPATLAFGLRVAWARRLAGGPPIARPWARAGAAVLLARERFGFERPIALPTRRDLDVLLGTRWHSASGIDELRSSMPESARDAFRDVRGPDDLWRAEAAVERRVAADADRTIESGRYGPDVAAAVFAALLVDTWRALAGVEGAATGSTGSEVLDALAA